MGVEFICQGVFIIFIKKKYGTWCEAGENHIKKGGF